MRRAWESPTVLSQTSVLVSLGSALVVLPLMVGLLSQAEIALWLYYALFINLGMLSDFGFGHALVRAAAYFRAGAKELPDGTLTQRDAVASEAGPNVEGLNALLATFGRCYLWIVAGSLALTLAFGGPLSVAIVTRTPHPPAGYAAGVLIWIGLGFSMLAGVWSNYLQGLNRVADAKRVEVSLGMLRVAIYGLVLLAGGGVPGMAAGSMLVAVVQWAWLRRQAIRAHGALGGVWPVHGGFDRNIFQRLWPATWRQGTIGLGGYFINQSGGLVASRIADTGLLAGYLLTIRLLAVVRGLALAPVQVAVPRFIALRAAGNQVGLKRELFRRIGLCVAISGVLPAILWIVVQGYVAWSSRPSPILPGSMYAFAAFIGLLEVHHCAYSVFYITKNQVPFLWASIISGLAVVGLSLLVVREFGVWGLLLAQGAVQAVFNNWYPAWLVFREMNIVAETGSAAAQAPRQATGP